MYIYVQTQILNAMKPATIATATIATLFASEAIKAGGKAFGEETSKLVSQLLALIRSRFKATKTEGILKMPEEQPNEINISLVKTLLVAQIEKDKEFADQIKEFLQKPESQNGIRQVAVEYSKSDSLNAKNINQEITSKAPSEQVIVSNSEIKHINLDKVNQKYCHDSQTG